MSHNPDDEKAVPVEQADRDAAAKAYVELTGCFTSADQMGGDWLARRFACHRLAHPAPQPVGDVKRLREALFSLQQASSHMLTGVGVHNDRKIDQHVPIAGPVVSALSNAEHKAREVLRHMPAALSQHPDPQPQTDVVERDNAEALRRAILTELDSLDPVDAEADSWIQGIADAMDVVRAFGETGR